MKYELQCRARPAPGDDPNENWTMLETGSGMGRLRMVKRDLEEEVGGDLPGEMEYRIVEVVPDPPEEPKPTIEEKHAAELEKLAVDEKRWTTRAKRAATMLKKIRRRKRRLERQYAREEPT